MTISAKVKHPKSDFTHVFYLHPGGQVTRSTVGVEEIVNCGVRTDLVTRDDLVRQLERQGYEEIED